jgi:hypothetical protein
MPANTQAQQAQQAQIAALLSETGAAHGEYEERALGGAYDENWPGWYADYLVQHGLGDLLGGNGATVERLGGLLKELDEAYRRARPAVGWPVYYAARLIAGL